MMLEEKVLLVPEKVDLWRDVSDLDEGYRVKSAPSRKIKKTVDKIKLLELESLGDIDIVDDLEHSLIKSWDNLLELSHVASSESSSTTSSDSSDSTESYTSFEAKVSNHRLPFMKNKKKQVKNKDALSSLIEEQPTHDGTYEKEPSTMSHTTGSSASTITRSIEPGDVIKSPRQLVTREVATSWMDFLKEMVLGEERVCIHCSDKVYKDGARIRNYPYVDEQFRVGYLHQKCHTTRLTTELQMIEVQQEFRALCARLRVVKKQRKQEKREAKTNEKSGKEDMPNKFKLGHPKIKNVVQEAAKCARTSCDNKKKPAQSTSRFSIKKLLGNSKPVPIKARSDGAIIERQTTMPAATHKITKKPAVVQHRRDSKPKTASRQ